jgi:hypothetical protein
MSTLPEPARVSADAELVNIYHVAFVPAELGADRCRLVTRQPYAAAGSAPPGVAVMVPPGGLSVSVSNGDANVGTRRFADEYQPLGTIASGSTVALRVPTDQSTQPWSVSIQPQGRATVCTGAGRAR